MVTAPTADVVASGALEEATATTLQKSHVGRSKVSREHAVDKGERGGGGEETNLD